MSSSVQRSSRSGGRSLFFHDLASPVSSHRGKFSTPGQAAAVSALWRENLGQNDLPPPPVFTLEDRADYSPEPGIPDYPMSPEPKSDNRTPVREFRSDSLTPVRSKSDVSSSSATPGVGVQKMQQTPSSTNWWSPARNGYDGVGSEVEGSPVDGVVQPGALIMFPPPRDVATPESQRDRLPAGNVGEKEWVTIYGFSPGDTNLVLREFEKCGVILKHVPGPRDSNWVHILFQNESDAKKALSKNGVQINGYLIVGVKPVDPVQRQVLNEKLNNKGFMTLPPQSSNKNGGFTPSRASPAPYYLQNSNNISQSSGSAVASPGKSVVSKVMDLMFGV